MTDTWFAHLPTKERKADTLKVGTTIIFEGDAFEIRNIETAESDSERGEAITFDVWAYYGEYDTCLYYTATDAVVTV